MHAFERFTAVESGRASTKRRRSGGVSSLQTRAFWLYEAEGPGFEPGRPLTRPNGFQDRRIQPLCHPSASGAMLRADVQALHWPAPPGRGGRVAEGTRLLSEYGDQYSIAGSNPALSVPLERAYVPAESIAA